MTTWHVLQRFRRDNRLAAMVAALGVLLAGTAGNAQEPAPTVDGYRGIWFTLGQRSEYGDKYSGGLGTYTTNHVPLAIYAPAVRKTFFVYGGTTQATERHLLCMAGVYDHETGELSKPVIVHDKGPVDDPHDNPSLLVDRDGYVWVFVSGRGKVRPGFIYRSHEPWSIASFDLILEQEHTYPQPWQLDDGSILFLLTRYKRAPGGPARELFWQTSADGTSWSDARPLATFEGHYQTSGQHGNKVATFFNYHPGNKVDRRTNLYYLQTTDGGGTWTKADGTVVKTPLEEAHNEALVIDYESRGELVYTCDINFDASGNPLLLYVVSSQDKPGPAPHGRRFVLTRWTGSEWKTSDIAPCDHNYDVGALMVEDGLLRVVAPTLPGPQPWQAGGELQSFASRDLGATWTLERDVTSGSTMNHGYVRRVMAGQDPFALFWADGNPLELSPSHLYMSNAEGREVLMMPAEMEEPSARPQPVTPGAALD